MEMHFLHSNSAPIVMRDSSVCRVPCCGCVGLCVRGVLRSCLCVWMCWHAAMSLAHWVLSLSRGVWVCSCGMKHTKQIHLTGKLICNEVDMTN